MSKEEPLTIREALSGHVHTRERGKDMAAVDDYPHLKFSNIAHYTKVLALANSLGGEALESFKNAFAYLERICERRKATGEVHPDCDEDSFYFRVYLENGDLDLDGGIIKHGAGRTHSVELCPKANIHWSMHT
jgi:hypothetical protein